MAKHSHWAQIKYKKAALDAKRSQLISKLIKAIVIAAREGNSAETNPKLRSAIEKAKEFNVPKENIERAIERGFKREDSLEEVFYEAYFEEIQLLIKAITDNKNRTLGEIKQILNKYGARLAEPGSVKWNFEEKVVFAISKDFYEEVLKFDELIEDIDEKNGDILLITSKEKSDKFKEKLKENNIEIKEIYLDFKPLNTIKTDNERVDQLIEELLNLQDVDEVFTNIIK